MADTKKRGLGRGLSALLPGGVPPLAAPAASPAAPASTGASTSDARPSDLAPAPRSRTYFNAGIEEVYPSPEQPRHRFEETKLAELAASIAVHGIITPLIVRPRPGGGYFLIAGERRWRAAQRAGLHQVPVVVQDVEDAIAFERALVENLQRADLGALEEAEAFQRLAEEYGLTQDAIALRIGKDRSTIANAIRLLKLPPGARQLLEDGQLMMGHARALLGIEDPVQLERAARTVAEKGMTARATEAMVKRIREGGGEKAAGKAAPAPVATKSADVRDLEERLTRSLGGPVTIVEDGPALGKAGRIEIKYLSLDHLDRLLDRLL